MRGLLFLTKVLALPQSRMGLVAARRQERVLVPQSWLLVTHGEYGGALRPERLRTAFGWWK